MNVSHRVRPLLVACCSVLGAAAWAADRGRVGYVDDVRGTIATDSQGECVKTQRWNKDSPCRDVVEKAAPVPAPEKITLSGQVLFDFNRADLRPEGRRELQKAIGSVKEKLQGLAVEQRQINVTGHTDAVGSDAYNQRLSERRARAVAEFMVEHGVDSRIIRARGAGEAEPVESNDTEAGRQANRRVEIEYRALAQPAG
jgi:OOP family OmpA-OmpF porin